MKLPRVVLMLGLAGLVPFLAVPLWMTLAGHALPVWVDRAWLAYVTLVAAFLAGSFWGFALPAVEGTEGQIGLCIASFLMMLTWVSMVVHFAAAMICLSIVFLLLLLADIWRERTLGTIEGYFLLRTTLTAGVILAIAWRWALGIPGS
jgi:hypothetical protein